MNAKLMVLQPSYVAELEAERDALKVSNETLRFQLLAAANYVDALGGDSKSYPAAIGAAKGE